MRLLSISILFLCASISVAAQKQNNNWCYGGIGVNFNATPITFFQPAFFGGSSIAAAASDRQTGQFLFSVSGRKLGSIFNRNFNVMPNGNQDLKMHNIIFGQPVNIVPFVNDENKYYVFHYGRESDNNRTINLHYSVVDMALDGGLGDVEANNKNIIIDKDFTGAMVAAKGCKGFWLITSKVRPTNSVFNVYRITSSGFNAIPIVSPASHSPDYAKLSPDRSTLAVLCRDKQNAQNGRSSLRLYDFNVFTGIIDNERIIDTDAGFVGHAFVSCEFSSNSQILYVNNRSRRIFQYDLSLGTTAAINASRQIVYTEPINTRYVHAMQMAPDSNIYVGVSGVSSGLSRLSKTNALFPNCTYTQYVGPNPVTNYASRGLPQAIPNVPCVGKLVTLGSRKDTSVCLKQPIVLQSPNSNTTIYKWQDGSTQSTFSAKDEGTYWVASGDSCCFLVDTFVVKTIRDTMGVSRDTIMCAKSSMLLRSLIQTPDATYRWNSGSTDDSLKISKPGTYWVTTTEICDVTIDTIHATAVEAQASITSSDTSICPGDTILITGKAYPPSAEVVWSNGSKQLTTKITKPGKYVFNADFLGCTASADINITYQSSVFIELGEDKEICTDEPLVLPRLVTSDETDVYLWQDGSSVRKYTVKEAGVYHVAVTNLCGITSRDTVTITTRNCHLFFPNAFTPNGDGRNDIPLLKGDLTNVTDYEIHIFHRWGEEVFTNNDINKGWDGTHNGVPAAMGTYAYYIKYKYHGEDKVRSGTLTLIR